MRTTIHLTVHPARLPGRGWTHGAGYIFSKETERVAWQHRTNRNRIFPHIGGAAPQRADRQRHVSRPRGCSIVCNRARNCMDGWSWLLSREACSSVSARWKRDRLTHRILEPATRRHPRRSYALGVRLTFCTAIIWVHRRNPCISRATEILVGNERTWRCCCCFIVQQRAGAVTTAPQ